MIRRLSLSALPLFIMLLLGCSGSDDGRESSAATAGGADVTIVPLPDDVGNAICSLTRHATERDLVAIFGEPNERLETGDMSLLRWKDDGWGADAMFGNGQLKLAGANAKQDHKRAKNPLKDHPTWIAGTTRLEEMESHLGAGVRVGVQWHAGSDVAQSIRNSPGFDESMTRDQCNERYAWTNLDVGSFGSLLFADGILQGAL